MVLALILVLLALTDSPYPPLKPLHAFHGLEVQDRFGEALRMLPDVNGDGYLDIAVGASGLSGTGPLTGAVFIFSGLDGQEIAVIDGEVPFSRFGRTIATGDLDGDGALELLVGAPYHSEGDRSECGRIYIYSITEKTLQSTMEGQTAYEGFGSALYCMDVNADDYEDIVVGAPGFSDAAGEARGAVYVFSGRDRSLIRRMEGEHTGDWFGFSLVCIDVDADGHGDPLIAAPGCDSPVGADAGRVYACSGRDGHWLYQIDPVDRFERFALSLGPLDDLTGDGIQELMITSLGEPPGKTAVCSGATGEVLYHIFAENLNDGRGHPCISSRDVSGDFVPDLIFGHDVGEQNFLSIHSGRDGSLLRRFDCGTKHKGFGFTLSETLDKQLTGYSRLALGANPYLNRGDEKPGFVGIFNLSPPEVLNLFKGPWPGGRFGAQVDMVRDLDGNGRHDLLVGCPLMPFRAGEKSGRIMIYSDYGGPPTAVMGGEAPGSRLGEALCGIGDLDGDGLSEFVAGAPGYPVKDGKDVGRVYLYSSAAKGFIKKSLTGRAPGDSLGKALCYLGEATGDLLPDFLVGVPGDSRVARNQGKVLLVSGATFDVEGSYKAPVQYRRVGSLIRRAGDLDADGVPDFLALALYRPGTAEGFYRVLAFSTKQKKRLFALWSPEPGIGFGASLLGIHDVDLDKVPDFLVGAPIAPGTRGEKQGRVYLYSGRKGEMLGCITGLRPNDQFGTRMSLMRDLDNDGNAEIAVAAAAEEGGRIYILSSKSIKAINRLDGYKGWDGFGSAMAGEQPYSVGARFSLFVGATHFTDRQMEDRGACVGIGFNLPEYDEKDPALALIYKPGGEKRVPDYVEALLEQIARANPYPLSSDPRELYLFKAALSPLPGEPEWLPLRLTPDWKAAIIQRHELQPGRKKMQAWLRDAWRNTEPLIPCALGFRFKMTYMEKGRFKERVLECMP